MTLRLTLTAPAATIDATDTEARTLAGIAVPYGQVGATSAGRLTIDAGAIRVPDDLRRVKLFREHGRTTPVGYALTSTDSPDRLEMTFTVGRTPDGDTALLEASEGIRDALSVELDNVKIEGGHVTGADLVAVAQVAVPAFSSAVLTGSDDGPCAWTSIPTPRTQTTIPTTTHHPPTPRAPSTRPPRRPPCPRPPPRLPLRPGRAQSLPRPPWSAPARHRTGPGPASTPPRASRFSPPRPSPGSTA